MVDAELREIILKSWAKSTAELFGQDGDSIDPLTVCEEQAPAIMAAARMSGYGEFTEAIGVATLVAVDGQGRIGAFRQRIGTSYFPIGLPQDMLPGYRDLCLQNIAASMRAYMRPSEFVFSTVKRLTGITALSDSLVGEGRDWLEEFWKTYSERARQFLEPVQVQALLSVPRQDILLGQSEAHRETALSLMRDDPTGKSLVKGHLAAVEKVVQDSRGSFQELYGLQVAVIRYISAYANHAGDGSTR